uniref:Succinate dehydrogenase subunit 4 n=1 Tax=Cyanophora biloba TaxID=1489483 RepID=A0A873WRN3_9EUKA|nr:succinate dehydrogenase subunit 4 [Cyanophora biloba]QPB15035.1 succinate dehydrogenase subunit 4 [Cyanophora biloba]
MNYFNMLQYGKIEWYIQKITALFLISPLLITINYVLLLFFFCFLHIELGFHSILEDYYQNIILRILVNFLFKFIIIFLVGVLYCTLIVIIV